MVTSRALVPFASNLRLVSWIRHGGKGRRIAYQGGVHGGELEDGTPFLVCVEVNEGYSEGDGIVLTAADDILWIEGTCARVESV